MWKTEIDDDDEQAKSEFVFDSLPYKILLNFTNIVEFCKFISC